MGATAPAAAAPAEPAATTYWGSFLVEDGAWAFAPVGPSARTVVDGTVEGLRLATVGTGADPRPPRGLPSFEALCGGTGPAAGEVRVGVVVDYGRPADAEPLAGLGAPQPAAPDPRGACAQVPEGSAVEVALVDVAALRVDAGVLCAVDGYPRTVCQPQVALPAGAQAPDEPVEVQVGAAAPDLTADVEEPPGPLAGVLGLGAALVAALGISAAVVVAARALRRRRRA